MSRMSKEKILNTDETKILEYIDFEKVNTLLEGFNQSTGFVTAILDLKGNILSKSGWRKICVDFHRANSITSERCTISDTVLAAKLAKGQKYHFYKCLNGLVDVAVPIVIKNKHIANLFSGQFFFEKPDKTFFEKQAERFGFDKTCYLKALDEVPVISEDKVKTIMEFLLNTTNLISDMTFQKLELMELNSALQISEERYRLVLENSIDAILLTSPDGSIQSANRAACDMFQRSEDEICKVGRDGLVFKDDPRLPVLIEERNRIGNTKGEILMVRKDGTIFPVELSTSIFTDQNEHLRSSMIIRDITERKITEEQLIIAKEKAEESDRLKTAFLQNMSHEIRTPMNAIMGFSDLISKQAENNSKLEKYSRIINQRCEDLLTIINDILEISKIESGKLPLYQESFAIADLFEELEDFYTGQNLKIKKDQLSFVVKYPAHTEPLILYSDKFKLKQIFLNLISNAHKFTESGTIECGYKLDKNDQVVFYVSDTGIGIPEDKHQFIFERFAQVESVKYGGTGLGLPIVKGLLNVLGGDIWLESTPGKGSTFYFNINIGHNPLVAKKTPEIIAPDLKDYSNKTIMVVEDDRFNSDLINEIISTTGIKPVFFLTGEKAIINVTEVNPDLILMDIGLPDMSGYDAIKTILRIRPQTKIIAQTAYAGGDDKEKAIRFGCIDYISKPFKSKSLLNIIKKHI